MFLQVEVSPEEAKVEVQIRTVDLNREPTAGVTVEAYNATADSTLLEQGITNQTGWVRFQLSNDTDYKFKAFWKEMEVGSLPKQRVKSDITIDVLQCSLAHIKVVVKDEAEVPLPYIDVILTYSYQSRYNETVSERATFETRENGTVTASNMLINANYTIEALRYGSLFDKTQISNLKQLLKDGWAKINITCPTYKLFIQVVDSDRLPLQNMKVEVYEWSSRNLLQTGTTNELGSVTFHFTCGRYTVLIRGSNEELGMVILNETAVDLFEDLSFLLIHCKIFNITPSVKVVDYLGQPVPDARVELQRKIGQEWIKIEAIRKTNAQGIALMPKIGGDYRVTVYIREVLCETRTLYLDETKVVFFKIEKSVMVGGHPIDTAQLITTITLILLIALLFIILSLRRLQKIANKISN